MKLSVNEGKLTVLWDRNFATIQLVLISEFTFRPIEKRAPVLVQMFFVFCFFSWKVLVWKHRRLAKTNKLNTPVSEDAKIGTGMDWIREFSYFQPILIVPSRAILKFKFRASTFGIVWLVRDNGTQIQCKTFGAMIGNELYILYRACDSRHTTGKILLKRSV